MGFFSGIGALIAAWAGNFRAGMDFLGETCVSAGTALVRPRTFRFGDFMLAFQRASYDGIPVAAGIGFLLGVILAFQSAAALRMFGVEVYVADDDSFTVTEVRHFENAVQKSGKFTKKSQKRRFTNETD